MPGNSRYAFGNAVFMFVKECISDSFSFLYRHSSHFCYFCVLQKKIDMNIDAFNLFLGVMSLIALVVFIALYFVKAGYGIFRTASWGVAISNKLAWILMEAPVFLVMSVMWIYSERRFEPVIFTFSCSSRFTTFSVLSFFLCY